MALFPSRGECCVEAEADAEPDAALGVAVIRGEPERDDALGRGDVVRDAGTERGEPRGDAPLAGRAEMN